MGHLEGVWLDFCFPKGQLLSFTGSLVHTLTGSTGNIWPVAFSPDGQSIVAGARDGTVHIWLSNGMYGTGVWDVPEAGSGSVHPPVRPPLRSVAA